MSDNIVFGSQFLIIADIGNNVANLIQGIGEINEIKRTDFCFSLLSK